MKRRTSPWTVLLLAALLALPLMFWLRAQGAWGQAGAAALAIGLAIAAGLLSQLRII